MIWLILLIPAFVTVFLVHRGKAPWHMYLVPLPVSALLILASKAGIERSQTTDTEWWTGWVVKATWDEHWTERQEVTTTDSKGNTTTSVYFVYHPDIYQVHDSNGLAFYCSAKEYDGLCSKFGNSTTQRGWHMNQVSWGDGRHMHTTYDDKRKETFTPYTSTHWYENRVQAAHSVFKFPKVDSKKLWNYPSSIGFYCPSVLGNAWGDKELTEMNARIGRKKQCRVWLLVFDDEPLQTGYDQEAYWQGGNKNEVVICVGRGKDGLEWVYCFSWTPRKELLLEIQDKVMLTRKLDIPALVQWLEPTLEEKFERKRFREFSYLSVEPPTWAIISVFIAITILNTGYIVYFVREFK